MTYQEMINMKVLSVREQIQEDLLTLLDHEDQDMKDSVCQIIVEHFKTLMVSLQSDVQVRAFCNNSLTTNKTE